MGVVLRIVSSLLSVRGYVSCVSLHQFLDYCSLLA